MHAHIPQSPRRRWRRVRPFAGSGPLFLAALATLVAQPLVLPGLAAASDAPPAASGAQVDELSAQVKAVAAELSLLKEGLFVPEQEVKKSQFGLGPAASKVYGSRKGLAIGGYGEAFFGHYLGDEEDRGQHRGDIYRFITYLGYKFNDWVLFNTEIEFEHAQTGSNPEHGKGGGVFVEFSYVDLLLSKHASLRTGLMLIPVGIVNEMHEPTTYRGNFRPEVERAVIPSTWREAGLGLFGELGGRLSYKLYLTNGLSAQGFGSKGVRGGRQKGAKFVWEDKALTLRLDWAHGDAIRLGASAFYGGADQDKTGDAEVTTLIYEAHGIFRLAQLELRVLYAEARIDGADEVGALQGVAADAEPLLVPEASRGWYVEASYELGAALLPASQGLAPFVRFEQLDLNASVPDGFTANEGLQSWSVTGGLEYKPHPDVVFKGEYAHLQTAAEDAPAVRELRGGVGFVY